MRTITSFTSFFPTLSSPARLAIRFIRACDATLLWSPSAAFRLLCSLMYPITEACSAHTGLHTQIGHQLAPHPPCVLDHLIGL